MDSNNRGSSAFGALLIGALGGALAVILTNPKKRAQIKSFFEDIVDTSQEKFDEVTHEGRRRLADKLDEVSDRIDDDRPRRRSR